MPAYFKNFQNFVRPVRDLMIFLGPGPVPGSIESGISINLSVLVQTGPSWSKLVQTDPSWSQLVQAGPSWSKLVQAGPN